MAGLPSTLSPTERFWRLLRPDIGEVRNLYAYALFHGLVYLSLPLGIQAIINLIQGGRVSTSWIVLTCIVVLGIAVTGVLQIAQLRITENLQRKIFARAAFEFAYRVPKVRMEQLYRHYAPELMNRFFDVLTVQKGLSKILVDFSVASLQVLMGLILLSLYHPFFIAFAVILVLLVVVIFQLTGRRGLETSLKESKYKYRLVHWLEELARTATTFKLAGITDFGLNRTNRHVDDYLDARDKHFGILIRQYSMMVVFKVLVATGLLAIGGYLVLEQRLNIGQFVAAEIIVLYVMSSVEKLVLSLETIYDVLTGLEKIGQVTDLEIENTSGMDMGAVSCNNGMEVCLEQVSFKYPDGNKDIIQNLDLYVGEGEKLVITGPNGSGKSTLLHLIAGLYDIERGSITYAGLPRNELDLGTLHAAIGDSLNEGLLFEGTVTENITIGRPNADFDRVREVVEILGLTQFIRRLESGYQTVLDPRGEKLPRSVVQKILLARAIVDRPKLLILEEALQYIDDAERRAIVDYLISPERPWTLIAVTSNDYFIEKATRKVIMTDGKI